MNPVRSSYYMFFRESKFLLLINLSKRKKISFTSYGMKKKLIVLSGFGLGLAPVAALAQIDLGGGATGNCVVGAGGTIFGIICRIGQILNSIVPVLIALGIVYFVWGVVTYMMAGDEEKKKEGRNKIIYGIIGLAVIVALWGLVGILTKTFGVQNTFQGNLPTIPVPNQAR